MTILDYLWENEYQMLIKTPQGDVTDFKITLDTSWETFEKFINSEDSEGCLSKMIFKLKPIIVGWENLVEGEGDTVITCTDENKERILGMFWIMEQVIITYATIMLQYCKVRGIEQNAKDFMKNLKETYNIN